jgi:hypothetical protein
MATRPQPPTGVDRSGRREKALKTHLTAFVMELTRRHEHAHKQLADTLCEMALRLAMTTRLCPLRLDDMSPAELLACHLLPEHLRPQGLPTEDEIWAEYRDRQSR